MRPLPLLPHPTAEFAITVGSRQAIDANWFNAFSSIVDLLPKSGTVTFAAAATAAVTFDKAEADTNYTVLIESPEDRRVWITLKATTGFTVNVSAASVATYGWVIVRR